MERPRQVDYRVGSVVDVPSVGIHEIVALGGGMVPGRVSFHTHVYFPVAVV